MDLGVSFARDVRARGAARRDWLWIRSSPTTPDLNWLQIPTRFQQIAVRDIGFLQQSQYQCPCDRIARLDQNFVVGDLKVVVKEHDAKTIERMMSSENVTNISETLVVGRREWGYVIYMRNACLISHKICFDSCISRSCIRLTRIRGKSFA
jgi:hypothetical protein